MNWFKKIHSTHGDQPSMEDLLAGRIAQQLKHWNEYLSTYIRCATAHWNRRTQLLVLAIGFFLAIIVKIYCSTKDPPTQPENPTLAEPIKPIFRPEKDSLIWLEHIYESYKN